MQQFEGLLVNRVVWMDLTRFVAILLVVTLHATDHVKIPKMVDMDSIQFIMYQTIRILGRIAVPLFFMISGALVLKAAGNSSPLDFYKKRIPQFIVLLVFYFYANNLIMNYINHKSISMEVLTENIIHGNLLVGYHLWFMYTIIGLYLVAPFISKMLMHLTTNEILTYLSICFALCFLAPSYTMFTGKSPITSGMGGDFLGVYIVYFIFGYLVVDRNLFFKTKLSTFTLVSIFAFLSVLVIQIYLRGQGKLTSGEGFTWYNSPGTLFFSASVFITLSKVKINNKSRVSNTLEFLSTSSFCVFLIHMAALELVFKRPVVETHSDYINIIVMILLTYIMCLIYYVIMSKNRITRYLVK
ncbi:acyltransferase [Serratia marcescens]|uniref:acyltransferase n=1 Tax=Serratia marcescens TaxID=615 RepID=UPI003204AC0F